MSFFKKKSSYSPDCSGMENNGYVPDKGRSMSTSMNHSHPAAGDELAENENNIALVSMSHRPSQDSGQPGKPVPEYNNSELPSSNGKGYAHDKNTELEINCTDEEDAEFEYNCCSRQVRKLEIWGRKVFELYKRPVGIFVKILLVLAYFAYFIYCMYYKFGDEGSIMLLVITCWAVMLQVGKLMDYYGVEISTPQWLQEFLATKTGRKVRIATRYLLYVVGLAAVVIYVAIAILQSEPKNLQAVVGLLALILISYVCSFSPSRVKWHPVFWAFFIQFFFAFLTLRTSFGYDMFKWLGDAIQTFMEFADPGTVFIFGPNYMSFGLAFAAAGILIFFNVCLLLLSHWGAIEYVVVRLGKALSFCLDTGPVESVVAAASIFVGVTELTMLVRPYMTILSKSELHSIMTSGFASIAGTVMGFFIIIGAPANHLLTAAVISAPAALAAAKLIYPETKRVDYDKQADLGTKDEAKEKKSILALISEGAMLAVKVITFVLANMIAIYSLMYMVNEILTWMGKRAGYDHLTFELICGYILYPIALFMGVVPDDCTQVAALIGTKLVATPMVAYQQLGIMRRNRAFLGQYLQQTNGTGTWHWEGRDVILDMTGQTLPYGYMGDRAEVIATYALCGFSSFTSIAMSVGVLVQLSPPRKPDILEVVGRAFLAGNMASFFTGAVAGVMYTE